MWNWHVLDLYLPDFLASSFGSFAFPAISKDRVHSVREQDQQRQTPHQSDGVEEVGVSGACIDPQMMECWSKK